MAMKFTTRFLPLQLIVTMAFVFLPELGFSQEEFSVGDAELGKAGQVLLLILVLAILLETGLSTLFNWRLFLKWFEGRGLKTPIAVAAAGLFVQTFKIDAVAGVLSAFGETIYPASTGGRLLTALIIAGGSGAVFALFEKLGMRNPLVNRSAAETMRQESHIKVQISRKTVPSKEPVTVKVDGTVIGVVESNKIRFGGMLGYKVEPGARTVELSGLDADGAMQTMTRSVTIGPGATAVESFDF